jgi:hypothetical protein
MREVVKRDNIEEAMYTQTECNQVELSFTSHPGVDVHCTSRARRVKTLHICLLPVLNNHRSITMQLLMQPMLYTVFPWVWLAEDL